MKTAIYLKKGKDESLKRKHPWIFSGAINQERLDEKPFEGEVVKVFTNDNRYIATGHYHGGTIAIRILSFKDKNIDEDFYTERLTSALHSRLISGVIKKNNNIYRLVHGEGDSLPGLIIDCYGKTAIVQAHTTGIHLQHDIICKALVYVMQGRIDNVYYKSDTTLSFDKIEKESYSKFIYGETDNNLGVENGLTFNIDWFTGQKTGFFIDQRDNRSLLEYYAKDKRVLNMFCYTGGFSVYALRGGAKEVHSLDSSARAIELTKSNVLLNFPKTDKRHKAICEDAFHFLENNKNEYDLIVLDPPAFAKHRSSLNNALKGYVRLNALGLKAVKRGGIIFTFSCSQVVSKEHFRNAILSAAIQAGRNIRILHQLHQPADHPVSIYHPEGEYLKGLVLYIE